MRALSAMFLLASALVAAVGCSSSDDEASASSDGARAGSAPGTSDGAPFPTSPATSGTRLRARWVSGGGARELVGFFDTQRNEECTFQRAGDGRMRCLPTSAVVNPTNTFADAACTIPLGLAQQQLSCDAQPTYATTYRSDGTCGTRSAELRRIVGPATTSYVGSPSACSPGQAVNGRFVVLGDVIPWAEFVVADEARTPGALVTETVLTATDGTRQHLGYRIASLDVACDLQMMADGVTRCVPEGGSGPVLYGDGSCTTPSVVIDHSGRGGPCATPPAKLWREPDSDATCRGIRAVYALRDDASGITFSFGAPYRRSSASGTTGAVSCTSAGYRNTFDGGRAIDQDLTASLPTTTRIGTGAGRLVPALVGQVGSAALVPGFHDTEKGTDCTFTTASDGKLRCLPIAAEATLVSEDATCGAPPRFAALGPSPCTGGSRFALRTSSTCPATTRVFAIGTDKRSLTNASTETSPGRCATLAGVENAFEATELDPTEFVEGVVSTE